MADAERKLSKGKTRIDFQTEPARYRHWKLRIDGEVPTLLMDVDEKGTLFEGYELKLNSYDPGVDIELADALDRLRFEHPSVKVVLLRSGKPRVFCTTEEGVKGKRAAEWRLVDEVVSGSKLEQAVSERAKDFAARSHRPSDAQGIVLMPLGRERTEKTVEYSTLTVEFQRAQRL